MRLPDAGRLVDTNLVMAGPDYFPIADDPGTAGLLSIGGCTIMKPTSRGRVRRHARSPARPRAARAH
jgi:hypothetical protein